MSNKIHPSEIRNPRLTLERRMREAGLEPAPAASAPEGDSGQTRFTRRVPVSPEQKARQDKQFEAIMRRREAERKTKGYAKGGVTRADGCITKGHTKGKMR